jgi:hypothetical protein
MPICLGICVLLVIVYVLIRTGDQEVLMDMRAGVTAAHNNNNIQAKQPNGIVPATTTATVMSTPPPVVVIEMAPPVVGTSTTPVVFPAVVVTSTVTTSSTPADESFQWDFGLIGMFWHEEQRISRLIDSTEMPYGSLAYNTATCMAFHFWKKSCATWSWFFQRTEIWTCLRNLQRLLLLPKCAEFWHSWCQI